MTCREIQGMLPGYIDAALSEFNRQTVAEHVAACPVCQETLTELSRAMDQVKALNEIDPPDWLKDRIMQQVRAEASANKWRSLLRRFFYPLEIKIPLQALAAVVVAVMAIYLYHTGAPEVGLPPTPTQTLTQRSASRELMPVPDEEQEYHHGELFLKPHKDKELDAQTPAKPKGALGQTEKKQESPASQPPVSDTKSANEPRQNMSGVAAQALPAGAMQSNALVENRTAQTPLSLTLQVADLPQALKAVEKILQEYQARVIGLEHAGNTATLRLMLKEDQPQRLLARIVQLGKPVGDLPAPVSAGHILTIRLEQPIP